MTTINPDETATATRLGYGGYEIHCQTCGHRKHLPYANKAGATEWAKAHRCPAGTERHHQP